VQLTLTCFKKTQLEHNFKQQHLVGYTKRRTPGVELAPNKPALDAPPNEKPVEPPNAGVLAAPKPNPVGGFCAKWEQKITQVAGPGGARGSQCASVLQLTCCCVPPNKDVPPKAGVDAAPNRLALEAPNAGVGAAPNAGALEAPNPNAGAEVAPNAGAELAPKAGVLVAPKPKPLLPPKAGAGDAPKAGADDAPKPPASERVGRTSMSRLVEASLSCITTTMKQAHRRTNSPNPGVLVAAPKAGALVAPNAGVLAAPNAGVLAAPKAGAAREGNQTSDGRQRQ
jgi:hypothetical protein